VGAHLSWEARASPHQFVDHPSHGRFEHASVSTNDS
jgi:hypothetical protein